MGRRGHAVRPLSALLRRFSRAREGIAALEFALIAPIMVAFYIGAVEFSQAFLVDNKIEQASSALADLAAQTSTIGSAEMTNILDAASTIVAPFPADDLGLRLSGVRISSAGVARIAWSRARGRLTPRGTDSTVTLPTSLNAPNSFLVMAEVTYDYTPLVGRLLPTEMRLDSTFYTRPRLSAEIALQ